MIDIRNVLVPVDFSDTSLKATEYGLAIARRFDATLHLLHVIEDPIIYVPMFESFPVPSGLELETYAQDRLENWIAAEDVEGCKLGYHWLHGRPFLKIVEFAADCRVDLIILGTHGRGGAAHMLLGSVAEKVVRKSPCPVFTINLHGRQFVHA